MVCFPGKLLAIWNGARGAWETDRVSLFCGHSELFSRTWAKWGSTRNGAAYERMTPVPLTGASASSYSDGLLPSPVARDWKGIPGKNVQMASLPREVSFLPATESDAEPLSPWGRFTDAIARWEAVLGRPAPEATVLSKHGNPRLSPLLPEWMIGQPKGWVTGVPGLSREDQFRLIGNGVCPQQGELALRLLLERTPGPVRTTFIESIREPTEENA